MRGQGSSIASILRTDGNTDGQLQRHATVTSGEPHGARQALGEIARAGRVGLGSNQPVAPNGLPREQIGGTQLRADGTLNVVGEARQLPLGLGLSKTIEVDDLDKQHSKGQPILAVTLQPPADRSDPWAQALLLIRGDRLSGEGGAWDGRTCVADLDARIAIRLRRLKRRSSGCRGYGRGGGSALSNGRGEQGNRGADIGEPLGQIPRALNMRRASQFLMQGLPQGVTEIMRRARGTGQTLGGRTAVTHEG